MWEEINLEFKGRVVKGIFEWKKSGTINLTDKSFMIVFEDNSQLLISVPKESN